jgi:hypothetical protein
MGYPENFSPRIYHTIVLDFDNHVYPKHFKTSSGAINSWLGAVLSVETSTLKFDELKWDLMHRLSKGNPIISLNVSEVKLIDVSLTRRGTFNWRQPDYPNGNFLLDIKLELNNGDVFRLEADALEIVEVWIKHLKEQGFNVLDSMDLEHRFLSVEATYKARNDHIAAQYDALAYEYSLENPRVRIEVIQ